MSAFKKSIGSMPRSRLGWLIVILFSLFAQPFGAQAQPAAPTATISAVTTGGFTLSWTAVNGATRYEYKRLAPDEADAGATNASTTSVNITGLQTGTLYSYTVRAVVGNQRSAWSANVNRYTNPSAPQNLRTTCVAGTVVKITWNEPPRAKNYEIKINNGGWGSRSASFARKLSGLSLNTQYTFHVRAVNTISGADSFSSSVPLTVRTQAAHVDEPSALQVSEIKNNSFKLTWTASSTSSVTYEVSSNGINWTDTGSDTEHVLSNLSGDTSYNFQLRAKSGSTYSCIVSAPAVRTLPVCAMQDKEQLLAEIDAKIVNHRDNTGRTDLVTAFTASKNALTGAGTQANAVALAPHGGELWRRIRSALNCLYNPAPAAPKGVSANNITSDFITLIWTVTVDVRGYRVRAGNSGDWTTLGRNGDYTFTGLSANTEYTLQVVASSGWHDSSPVTVTARTLSAPAAPTGLQTSAITHNSITLSWTKSAGAFAYKVRTGTSGAWTTLG
ncbi:MAG: fibronectin type III domain-containing protein, partial [Chloroflexi bacterium]|nr:fibronectin type III domain-containing protein [Chloroflexota bacterium]